MFLTNSEHINFGQEVIKESTKTSYLHWLPFQYLLPETTRITMQRYHYQTDDNQV